MPLQRRVSHNRCTVSIKDFPTSAHIYIYISFIKHPGDVVRATGTPRIDVTQLYSLGIAHVRSYRQYTHTCAILPIRVTKMSPPNIASRPENRSVGAIFSIDGVVKFVTDIMEELDKE